MQYATRTTAIQLIRDLEIPKSMLAGAAQISPARISDFCRNRPLPTWQEEKISTVAQDIAFVWNAFRRGAPGAVIIVDNPTILKKLVSACRQAELATELNDATTAASEAFRAAFSQ